MNTYLKLFITVTLLAAFTASIQAQNNSEAKTEAAQKNSAEKSALEMFDWIPFDKAIELAKGDNKKILLYVNARWCGYCKKMENEVFVEQSIQDLTSEYFYPVWLDLDVQDEYLTYQDTEYSHRGFAQKLGAYSTPTFIFFDENENIIAGQPGFLPEDLYSTILKFIGTEAYKDQTFTEFTESK